MVNIGDHGYLGYLRRIIKRIYWGGDRSPAYEKLWNEFETSVQVMGNSACTSPKIYTINKERTFFQELAQPPQQNASSIHQIIKQELRSKLELIMKELNLEVHANLNRCKESLDEIWNLVQNSRYAEAGAYTNKLCRSISEIAHTNGDPDEIKQRIMIKQINEFLTELGQMLITLQIDEKILLSKQIELNSLKQQQEYFCKSGSNQDLRHVLSSLKEYFVKSSPTVFIIQPELSTQCNSESWVKPFVDGITSLLEIAGIEVVTQQKHAKIGTNKSSYYQLAQKADFDLIFLTPSMKSSLESDKWKLSDGQYVHALRKQNIDESIGLNRVIPIQLCGLEHERITFMANIHQINWSEAGFIPGLKMILSQIYFQSQQHHEDYDRIWSAIENEPAVDSIAP